MVIMVRYSENLPRFAICDIYYIYICYNFGDMGRINDCVYISHFLFTKSEIYMNTNHTKIKFYIIYKLHY